MRIDQQVHADLAQPGRVTEDPGQRRLQVGGDLDLPKVRLVTEQFEDFQQDRVHIDLGQGTVRFSAETEQMVDDPLAAIRLPNDHLQIMREDIEPVVLFQGRLVAQPALQRFGASRPPR